MLVIEAKLKNGTPSQYAKLDDAIRTAQFVRNSCLRYWMDNKGVTRNDLQKLCAVLAKNKETPWVNQLNSQARQSSADRAWQSIQRFYQNCREGKPGKKGFPLFKRASRSVEYKQTGYKLSFDRRQITFIDGFKAGTFNLWCSQKALVYYSTQQIKRVRVVRRADGYYAQFLVDADRKEQHEYTGSIVGIDLGLKEFYTDSKGNAVENPRYLRKSEKRLKKLQRKVSRRHRKLSKGQSQSKRYRKARQELAKQHLKVTRQRKDRSIKDALALVKSNDLIVYVGVSGAKRDSVLACAKRIDLKIQNMVRNHQLAKSISDASRYQFTQWVKKLALVHGVICLAVPPHNTTVDCSCCGAKVHKTLSTRTHKCVKCGTVLDRDYNAAKNILAKGLKLLAQYLNSTGGHPGTGVKSPNAQGQIDLCLLNGDAQLLSRLDELRISIAENPPLYEC